MSASNLFNYPIYDYAVGWWNRQPANPLTFLAPFAKAEGLTGTYKFYPQGDTFRRVDTRRAKYSGANLVDTNAEERPYLLEDHSLSCAVDDSEIKGAGNKKEAADQIAESKMGNMLSVWRTSFIADGFDFFRAAVPATTSIGGISNANNWSSAGVSAVKALIALRENFFSYNGVYPNRYLFSNQAWNILNENAEVLDFIAFNSVKRLDTQLFMKLLDIDSDQQVQVMRASVPIGSDRPGPEVRFKGQNLMGSDFWMTYSDPVQSIHDISAMKTLSLGGEDVLNAVESYYERRERTTFYDVQMHRQFIVSAPSAVRRMVIS